MAAQRGTHMHGEEWVGELKDLFRSDRQGVLHLIGVGNPLRRDDGLGIRLINDLRSKYQKTKSLKVHPPTLRSESLISRIDYSKDKALIFDAVECNSPPGSIVFSSLKDSRFGFFATHNIPMRSLPEVAPHLDRVLLLGIQPKDVDVGEGLSEQVNYSVGKVVSVLTEVMK